MNATEPHEVARREPASHIVAGFMAAASIFASVIAIAFYPGRIGPGAILIALIACAMAGPAQRRLTAGALVIATVCWFAGMVVSVILERPIF
jgi:hypothetical protein